LLTQIARAQGLQRRFDQAHATLDEAAALLEPGLVVSRVRYLLERGRVFNLASDKQQASPLFDEAWRVARDVGEDFYAVDAAHMLGICEPPESALAWNERALELAEKSPQPRAKGWLGSLYNNIGWTYHDLGRFEQALEMFTRALEYWQKQPQPDRLRIARWTVARATRSLGRFHEAVLPLAHHGNLGQLKSTPRRAARRTAA
jgi:tetratricopeptide (TPR) repeat protein